VIHIAKAFYNFAYVKIFTISVGTGVATLIAVVAM
jgi:hypothetical protein